MVKESSTPLADAKEVISSTSAMDAFSSMPLLVEDNDDDDDDDDFGPVGG